MPWSWSKSTIEFDSRSPLVTALQRDRVVRPLPAALSIPIRSPVREPIRVVPAAGFAEMPRSGFFSSAAFRVRVEAICVFEGFVDVVAGHEGC